MQVCDWRSEILSGIEKRPNLQTTKIWVWIFKYIYQIDPLPNKFRGQHYFSNWQNVKPGHTLYKLTVNSWLFNNLEKLLTYYAYCIKLLLDDLTCNKLNEYTT